jgi:hypothetical protein
VFAKRKKALNAEALIYDDAWEKQEFIGRIGTGSWL